MAEEEKKKAKVVEEEKVEETPKKEDVAEETTEEKKEVKKKKKREIEAVVNIYTSFNNTIVHVTDMSGVTISKVTGGMVTKHNRLKANPTIAMFIAKRIGEEMKEKGITTLYVRIRAKTGNPAPGPGANALIKSLSREGFRIANILDITRHARGGPKVKGGRRGRRP
jgi:small subunit ribosomal protein S11